MSKLIPLFFANSELGVVTPRSFTILTCVRDIIGAQTLSARWDCAFMVKDSH